MEDVELVPFDRGTHIKEFHEMNMEYMTWVMNELDSNYQIDSLAMMGMSVKDIVDSTIGEFLGLKPPEGVLLIAKINGKVVGMGAVTKMSVEVGEIKRMYNRPQYRGRGIGKKMLHKLLERGRELGCVRFLLDTPKWAHVAQHIYRSAGFKEIEEYQESQIPSELRRYWMYMEKEG